MGVQFRNLETLPSDPISEWGVEGLLTALERGSLSDWRRIALTAAQDATSDLAADLDEALSIAESHGGAEVVAAVLERLRADPRQATLRRLRQAFLSTELSQAEAARRLETSASRLSTYLSGSVMPSAQFLTRLERLASKRTAEVGG